MAYESRVWLVDTQDAFRSTGAERNAKHAENAPLVAFRTVTTGLKGAKFVNNLQLGLLYPQTHVLTLALVW